MRTILFPTDFSSNALNAVTYALQLYKFDRCNFYFLHAYADEVYGPFKKKTARHWKSKKIQLEKM